MPMIWNDAAIAKVFAAVLATGDVKVDTDKIADYMGCSSRALKDQLAKLRKNSDIDVGFVPKAKTPNKRKNSADVGGGGRAAADDSEIDATPSKPRKTPRKASSVAVMDDIKEEDEEDEGEAV